MERKKTKKKGKKKSIIAKEIERPEKGNNEENNNGKARKIFIKKRSNMPNLDNIPTEMQILDMIIGIKRKSELTKNRKKNLNNISEYDKYEKRLKTHRNKKKRNDYEIEVNKEDKKEKKKKDNNKDKDNDLIVEEGRKELFEGEKRRISKSEDIRRYFRTEDKH